ncbi:MAG: glycosyltransferase [Candidatus Sulfotelmatobacter sp.]|jgi:glycosyltransferase involved in cell wall biosynthesis
MKRILHVVGGLNSGGVESWLVQVYRAMDRSQYNFDFLVHSHGPFHYEEEVKSLGAKVIFCEGFHNPLQYAINYSSVVKKHGPYDCVHSHVHLFSGYVAALAAANCIPLRIVQSHLDTSFAERQDNFARKSYATVMRKAISLASNSRTAVSQAAGDSLFGNSQAPNSAWSYLPLGIDLEPYKHPVNRDQARAEFGLASGDLAIFHVGRFDEQKNHKFLIEVAASLCADVPAARFFLIGDGPLRARIQEQVRSCDLEGRVHFLGVRRDVPQLLRGAADLFLFPSLYEGLGLAHVEAQLAGLLSIASDAIPAEADILPSQVIRKSLEKPSAEWAQEIVAVVRAGIHRRTVDFVALESTISIEASAKHLSAFYSTALARISAGAFFASTGASAQKCRD